MLERDVFSGTNLRLAVSALAPVPAGVRALSGQEKPRLRVTGDVLHSVVVEWSGTAQQRRLKEVQPGVGWG